MQNQIDGFSSLGFESAYQSRTLGTAFLWYLLITCGFIGIVILTLFSNIKYLSDMRNKLIQSLCWNKVLRTIMQTSLELTFCAYFTLKYSYYDGKFCSFINISYAIVFAVLISLFPILSAIFYKINFKTFKSLDQINQDN